MDERKCLMVYNVFDAWLFCKQRCKDARGAVRDRKIQKTPYFRVFRDARGSVAGLGGAFRGASRHPSLGCRCSNFGRGYFAISARKASQCLGCGTLAPARMREQAASDGPVALAISLSEKPRASALPRA